MDYAHRRRLKIWGRAQVIDDNPELLEQLADRDYQAEKARVILIQAEAFDWNCPQHIPIRYSEAEVAQIKAPLEARIQELEQQIAQLSLLKLVLLLISSTLFVLPFLFHFIIPIN